MDENHIKSILCCDDGESSQFETGFVGHSLLYVFSIEIAKAACIRVVSPHLVLPNSSPILLSTFVVVHYFSSSSPHCSNHSGQFFALTGSKEYVEESSDRTSHGNTSKTFPQKGKKLEP